MSGLIKASDRALGTAVANFDGGAAPVRPESMAAIVRDDPAVAEIARLQALVASKDAEIEELRAAVQTARAEGVQEGRDAMEIEFENSRDKALELLEKGIAGARESLAEMHERLEVLALLVTRTAIEKLFGQDGAREAAVIDLARGQLARIERQSVIAIEISRSDFPDTGEVAHLARRLGVEVGQVVVSDALDAGACRMRLKLGTIDAGLDQQWGAVRKLLDSMATEALVATEGDAP